MDRAARRREPEVWDPGTFRTRSGGAGTAQIRRGAQETPPSLTPEEIARYRAYVRAKRAERDRIRRIEAERERRRQEQERLMRKKRRRRARKVFGARLILFLVILLLVAGVTALGLVIAFHHTSESGGGSGRVVYLYGGREARTVSRSAAEQNGVLYFCFNDLSDYLGLAESGSARAMKFVFPTGEETRAARPWRWRPPPSCRGKRSGCPSPSPSGAWSVSASPFPAPGTGWRWIGSSTRTRRRPRGTGR